jgi:thiol-disulfide isomerase/thioredoxin
MPAAGAARSGRLVLAALVVAGLAGMAALRALHSDTTTDMVELLGHEPVKLSPFLDARGAEVSPDSFRGRVLILNLWAPWCVPCLAEMPSLDRLAARLPEKDFAVFAVTKDPVGDSPSKRLFDKMGLARLRLYLDPKGKLENEVGLRGYPTTLIIGADGAPLARREGAAAWDSDEMVAKLETLKARSRGAE